MISGTRCDETLSDDYDDMTVAKRGYLIRSITQLHHVSAYLVINTLRYVHSNSVASRNDGALA